MMGAVPNPNPTGGNWAVLFGAMDDDEDGETVEDEDELDGSEEVAVVALTPDHEIPGVSEVEHRFRLVENSAEEPGVVYVGNALHRHGDEFPGDCETFLAEEGQATVEDIPDDLRDCLNRVLDMEIYAHGESPVDAEPVLVEEVLSETPDTDPGGMFY